MDGTARRSSNGSSLCGTVVLWNEQSGERYMKKVLFAIHALGFGGAERSLVNLLNELPKEEYEIDLLLFRKEGAFLSQIPSWVNILEIPDQMRRLYGPVRKAGNMMFTKVIGTACARICHQNVKARTAFRWKHFYSKRIGRILGHYDVAAAYTGSEVMYLIGDCVDADRKLVWIHNDYRSAGYSQVDDLPYMEHMDAVISVSEECVTTLKDVFPQFEKRMLCVENITSSALVRKQSQQFYPKEYEHCSCKLLSIGRLSAQKGFDLAISAAAIMKRQGLSFRWFIIGEGKLGEALAQQIRKEQVDDCVILLGTRENPYPYIKHCTLMVQPSRFEGKSVVLDETKILGVPIAATSYPTVSDQIKENLEGIILPISPQELAEGIMKLLADDDKMASIRSYLCSHEYGNQQEVEKYRKLLDGR